MANEKVTQLPTVTSVTLADILYVIQAGVSSQATVGQIVGGTVQPVAGNPNNAVAGDIYQPLWDTTDNILWICTTSGSVTTAVWTPVIGALTNGQLRIGSAGQAPAAATLTAGANITITNTAGGITITSTGTATGFSWTDVTGTTQAMITNNGYAADNAAAVTFTLPTTAAFGDRIALIGKGAGGWIITQGAGQSMIMGAAQTTLGAGGSFASNNRNDAVNLICTVANTTFAVTSVIGNITIV